MTTTDPEVERLAEQYWRFSLMRPTPGLTSGELAARHGLDRHMVARRLPEAARVGLITRREIGAQEVTWWPR